MRSSPWIRGAPKESSHGPSVRPNLGPPWKPWDVHLASGHAIDIPKSQTSRYAPARRSDGAPRSLQATARCGSWVRAGRPGSLRLAALPSTQAISRRSKPPTRSCGLSFEEAQLFPADGAQRGDSAEVLRVLRLQGRWPRALHRAHLLRRSEQSAQRRAARKYRGARAGVLGARVCLSDFIEQPPVCATRPLALRGRVQDAHRRDCSDPISREHGICFALLLHAQTFFDR
jgi:hypothetical protein